jgi:hypothetical protein
MLTNLGRRLTVLETANKEKPYRPISASDAAPYRDMAPELLDGLILARLAPVPVRERVDRSEIMREIEQLCRR